MSTSYQTAAKPRGRHDLDNADKPSRSRATSEASQKLSKKMSRTSDENAATRGSRPNSPALFMQRSRAIDERMSDIDPISPKSSTASMKAERQNMYNETDAPMLIPSSRSAPRATPLIVHESKSLRSITQTQVNSRPATPSSRASEITSQPKASSVAAPVANAMNAPSVAPPSPVQESSTVGSTAALQPSVEEVVDDLKPTPILAEPAEQGAAEQGAAEQAKEDAAIGRVGAMQPFPNMEFSVEQNGEQPITKTISHISRSATPAMSPPNSPHLNHYGGYPGQAPMQYQYYPQHMMQHPPSMYGGPYYPAPFSPPSEHSVPNSEGQPRSASDDEHHRLMEKVSNVLPDINRLLDQYREAHGQLSARNVLVKQSESMHADQLNQLRVQLDAQKTEYEKVIRTIVSENAQLKRESEQLKERISSLEKTEDEHTKLKAELDKLQSSRKDLADSIDAVRLSKEQLLADKLEQDKNVESLKKQHHSDKEKHHRSVSDLKEQLKQQIATKDEIHAKALADKDEIHTKALSDRDREHTQILAEKEQNHSKLLGEHKIIVSKVQLELANLITKHSNQKKELEATRLSEAEHKGKFEAKTKELDETVARHAQELKTLQSTSEEEHRQAVNESEERSLKMLEDHNRKENEWGQSRDALRAEMQTLKDDFAKQLEAHELYKKEQEDRSARHAELATSMMSWKSKHSELQKENENMDRILQGLGHATEVKSKGDDFFIAAFRQLTSLIAGISRNAFRDVPQRVPEEIVFLIPSELPDFMGSSESAHELRSLYIQHKIWDILNIRIFQPFLFTLGRQYGGLDTFLLTLSHDIRRKSERREAAWRQTTLRAAYKVSQAKQAINIVASMIVDEILAEIKHFAVPGEWPGIATSVQRIVKSAAEVWRYARVEREMVTAFMPDATDDDKNDWYETPRQTAPDSVSPTHRAAETMILRVVPHIIRERVHADFLSDESKDETARCVYLQGLALFSESPIVALCRSEVHRKMQIPPLVAIKKMLSTPRHANSHPSPDELLESPGSIRSWKSAGAR